MKLGVCWGSSGLASFLSDRFSGASDSVSSSTSRSGSGLVVSSGEGETAIACWEGMGEEGWFLLWSSRSESDSSSEHSFTLIFGLLDAEKKT